MKYYIIAGEASGDLHGSNLMKGLMAVDTDARIRFWGGDMMRQACPEATLVHHYKDGAVMGFAEVLTKAGRLMQNIRLCKEDIASWGPDVIILIDYPGFNFKIARWAHYKGFKVFYYIAPKTWASREGRNRKLKAWVDRLFIVFPFEIPYFKSRGIPFTYEGNPLLDAVDNHEYSPVTDKPYIAILAGSRQAEIKRMMPVCMDAAAKLLKKDPSLHFIIAGAPSRSLADYQPYIPSGLATRTQIVFDRTYDVLKYSIAAIINSGTASLEAALIGTPQVVGWSTSRLTYQIARHILKVGRHIRYISLGNLIIDKGAFRELIQDDLTADAVSDEIFKLMSDTGYRLKMQDDYKAIRAALGGRGASEAVALAMYRELKG